MPGSAWINQLKYALMNLGRSFGNCSVKCHKSFFARKLAKLVYLDVQSSEFLSEDALDFEAFSEVGPVDFVEILD